ncbi:type I-B CRISPR-associated protein Cas5b [Methanofollis fontis]|uniref:Type I-B CRISPR-associated protein Cas5 n=1 Tax=Methanofollis fontis TaxID=2052832 RepID=A0A483CPR6_9EURY|nr:type I-B CRISPR-associated protein Cas5b [Methanofollis fontis]TAJ45000.1 type I-B CRISPR-associated protein Cas5 [Methanofollis fontis]
MTMSPEKVLVFDLWGPYAHFRKHYTTTTSNTFSFPPRPALIGLVGGMLGIEKRDRAVLCASVGTWEMAVIVRAPIRRMRETINYTSTSSRAARIQIVMEFLRDPRYRIFVKGSGPHFEQLSHQLQRHEAVFTPYMGITECIGAFSYVGEFAEEGAGQNVESVVHGDLTTVPLEPGVTYLTERAARSIDATRAPGDYATYVVRRDAQPIKTTNEAYVSVGGHTIQYL